MDFWEIVSYITVFFLGYIYREIILFRDLMKISKNIKNNPKLSEMLVHRDIESKEDDNLSIKEMHKLKHEVVNDIHYFYLEENNGFVCQGNTLAEAAQNYTLSKGKDTLGWFVHVETNSILCFNDNQCMEFRPNGSI